MNEGSARSTGGGAATSAGILFEAQIGALIGSWILVGQSVDRRLDLGDASARWMRFETEAPVDDILAATSNGGFIAFQVKTNLSISRDLSSPFGKTIGQFVRQWLACRDGDGALQWNRPMSTDLDRLVLAVAPHAPATVRIDLADALRLSAQPGGGTFTDAQAAAYAAYEACVAAAWADASQDVFDPAFPTRLASYIRILTIDALGAGREAVRALLQLVIAEGANADTALAALEASSAEMMARRGGADLITLRRMLLASGVKLAAPPAFAGDIAALRSHSDGVAEALGRYEIIESGGEKPLSIIRECQAPLHAAALVDSLLIVGEPGAGKSAVLNATARQLRQEGKDVVELAVDRYSIESLEGLKEELHLAHPLLDVLEAWDGDGPGWLIIDALDATRGGQGEAVFRTLIERLLEKQDNRWRVIASIRSFDLRMGQQYRALFRGAPPVSELMDPAFSAVRHVRIPTWSPAEFEQLLATAPALSAALEGAPPALRDLAAVPFNTRLIADLVKDGPIAGFAEISSQAELLNLYWETRVERLGRRGRAGIKAVVEAMVASRSLRAHLDTSSFSDAGIIDELAREGIILTQARTDWIQFRHHILFDYAASRVILDADRIISRNLTFPKAEASGLMLAPALSFLLRETWDRDSRRTDFWAAAAAILVDADGDPIIRSSTGRLAAEYPETPADTAALARGIVARDPGSEAAFVHSCGALAVRIEDFGITQVAPWIALVRAIADDIGATAGTFRFLLFKLIAMNCTPDEGEALGYAARKLLEYGYDNPGRLTVAAIDMVADSMASDPAASKTLLLRIFEPKRLRLHGHEEVPALAGKIEQIAAIDPNLAAHIYRETYAYAVIEDLETRMGGSQILSLTSNARQDYDLAKYLLEEYLPTFLRDYPEQAVRAIVDALGGFVRREHPIRDGLRDAEFTIGEHDIRLREDWSHIWAHDPDTAYGHGGESLVKKLLDQLTEVDDAVALRIANSLIDQADLALLWSRLFLAAVRRRDGLIPLLLPIAMDELFQTSPDTRKDAVDVVAAGYDQLTAAERAAFEARAMAFDFTVFNDPEAAKRSLLQRLFGTIGRDRLATPEAAGLLGESEGGDTGYDGNERPFVIRSYNGAPEPYHWIEGLDRESLPNTVLMAAIDTVKARFDLDQPTDNQVAGREPLETVGIDPLLIELKGLAATIAKEGQNEALVTYAEGVIGQALARMVDNKLVPAAEDIAATDAVLALLNLVATSAGPQVEASTEENFENSASWGSPAPRVEAAQVAVDLAVHRGDLYPLLEPTIDALLADPHPAVRLQAGLRLAHLRRIDREGFWRKLTLRFTAETNGTILDHLAGGVLGWILHDDPEKVEGICVALLDRLPVESERSAKVAKTIASLLAILWVTHAREASHRAVLGWITDPVRFQGELSQILGSMRRAFRVGLDGEWKDGDDQLRRRSFDLTFAIVDAAANGLDRYFQRAADVDPLPDGEAEVGRSLAYLLDTACRELFFATGAGRTRRDDEQVIAEENLGKFLEEAEPILHRIGDMATPHTVYYLLQLLEYLTPHGPTAAFDLTAHALRAGGRRTGYQFESLGADLLVRMVGGFLADHKEIFEEDGRRTALIDCLEIFMEAGWPSARRLLYRLPELIQ